MNMPIHMGICAYVMEVFTWEIPECLILECINKYWPFQCLAVPYMHWLLKQVEASYRHMETNWVNITLG